MELSTNLEVSHTFYAAKVVVVREGDGHILILRRNQDDERRPGEPDLPGGEVEKDETTELAARRETLQEAGIDLGAVALTPLLEVTKLELRDRGAVVVAVRQVLFLALVRDQDIQLGDEHDGGDWYPPDQAAQMMGDHPTKLRGIEIVQAQAAAGELPIAS